MAHQPVSDCEGELPRVGRPDASQPARRNIKSLLPGNFLELARAARPNTQERRLQTRRRIVLHDAGGTLAAQHALVDRMIAVALDVADLAVFQVDLDPATAGAHVAGRGLDLVGRRHGEVDPIVALILYPDHQLPFSCPRRSRGAAPPLLVSCAGVVAETSEIANMISWTWRARPLAVRDARRGCSLQQQRTYWLPDSRLRRVQSRRSCRQHQQRPRCPAEWPWRVQLSALRSQVSLTPLFERPLTASEPILDAERHLELVHADLDLVGWIADCQFATRDFFVQGVHAGQFQIHVL